jgi:hypothetical protein
MTYLFVYYNTNVMIYFSDETYNLPNWNHHRFLILDMSIAGHDVPHWFKTYLELSFFLQLSDPK